MTRGLSLPQLRRVLGAALLAAPLAVACSKSQPKSEPTGERPAPDAAAGLARTPPDAAPAVTTDCTFSRPDVTGCGGAEVVLAPSYAACGVTAEGDLSQDQCDRFCATFDTRGCHTFATRDGKPGVFCSAANPCRGRPTSAGAVAAPPLDRVVDHLAFARRLEAHSVIAFRELEADLLRLGAPVALVAACRVAAADEVRHARAMGRLLRARGAAPPTVDRPAAAGFSSLFELALHNEREGVIGETWGALLALHQAATAADADVRAELATIADDETRHAALSFDIAAWARTQLAPHQIAALDAARADALTALRDALPWHPSDAAATELGCPSPATSAAMLDALAPALVPMAA